MGGFRQWGRVARQSVLRGFVSKAAIPRIDIRRPQVIIAPHPDDETFGTGGLLAMSAQRHNTQVIFLTSGGGSHRGCCGVDEDQVQRHREETARRVALTVGVSESSLHFLRWRDGSLPHRGMADFAGASAELGALLKSITPDKVFVTHPLEGWSDHVAAEAITRAAIAKSGLDTMLYHYCVWFWMSTPLSRAWRAGWRNAHRIDISPVYEVKQRAIRAYLEEVAPCGVPWCGNLPPEFLRAFEWKQELYFRVPNLSDSPQASGYSAATP